MMTYDWGTRWNSPSALAAIGKLAFTCSKWARLTLSSTGRGHVPIQTILASVGVVVEAFADGRPTLLDLERPTRMMHSMGARN
eukprot:6444384-Pyramimonas_sp.AAC.1